MHFSAKAYPGTDCYYDEQKVMKPEVLYGNLEFIKEFYMFVNTEKVLKKKKTLIAI